MKRAIAAAASALALIGAIGIFRWLQREGLDIRTESGWWM